MLQWQVSNKIRIMEQDKQSPQAPDISNEEMKMPENTMHHDADSTTSGSVVSGIIITVLVGLLVLILAGMYFWFSQLTEQATPVAAPTIERPTAEENNEPESTTSEAATETLSTLSTSDELVAIEADLAATDLSAIDIELSAVEAQLDSLILGN